MPYIALPTITLLLTLLLGIYIFIRDGRKAVNRNFALLIISAVLWIFSNFMADISKTGSWNLIWSKAALVGPILVAYFFYKFSLLFPKPKTTRFPYEKVILIFAIIFIILSPTHWNVIKVELKEGIFEFTPGFLYIPFGIYFLSVIVVGLVTMLRGYYGFSRLEQTQIRLVMTGITLSAFGGFLTNLILPLLGNSRFISFGSYFILFFIIFTSYAIIRRGLFDIKIITTDLFTLVICIILIVKAIISETPQEVITNTIIFILVGFFGILLVRSVTREVKQRKQMEEMAKQVQKAYEVEKTARKELERLDAAKTQFILATQHHLRTPLTAMRGYLDLLLAGTYGKLNTKIKDIVLKFQVSTNRLLRVVNELLDISQFRLGKRVVSLEQNVQIKPLLEEVIEELKFEAKNKGIYLRLEKPEKLPLIKADTEKLKVALFNIIDNGIKYTSKGEVMVKVQTTDSNIQITVKDTGIGISKQDLKDLFVRTFERGEEAKKVHGTGRGIGLYIAHHIIKAHQGRVWAESGGKDKGSTFYVELPAG